jgi:hypothetical protein
VACGDPAVDGHGKEMLMMTELYGGARIAYIFNSIFCKKVQVWPPPRALVCAPNAAAHCLRTFTSLQ